MDAKVEFLYLDEQEMIQAGVQDMHRCVEVMEEVFDLMGQGDYVYGGGNHNSHGIMINFPTTSPFPNMPLQGPDRRFMAMVGYLGGRFNVCGEKWYGSNRENLKKGLPRSILMTMLNDSVTGQPLAFMSGNLVSAMRTGAIPGVGAKYLARKDSKVLGLVAAGVISKTCALSLLDVLDQLEEVRIYDLYKESSEKLAEYLKEKFPNVKYTVVETLEEAVRDCDVINLATSGKVNPKIEGEWVKPGALFTLPAGVSFDKDFLFEHNFVADNWKMYEAFAEEIDTTGSSYAEQLPLLAGQVLDYVEAGEVDATEIRELRKIISGHQVGRTNDDEIFMLCMGGMPGYDIAWSYECYENAKKLGLGQTLKVWDTPEML